jgi:deoxyribonuclease-4
MERFFGAHVSVAGGLEKSLEAAEALGVNTIQVHPSPPQKWNSKPFAAGVESKFNDLRAKSGVQKVFFHGIYLINLANPDDQKFHLSKVSLVNDLDLLARLNGDGLIFHLGSLKDQKDEKVGYRRVADGINWVMENSKNQARLILEVAAGSGAVIGDRLEELAEIYSMVECKERVGFGLDSQHLWASGYDLQNDLAGFVRNLEQTLTFDKIWSVHLNDSMTALGSRKDRHENIGHGLIGKEALESFINHPKLRDIPFILETPALKTPETAKAEVDAVRPLFK